MSDFNSNILNQVADVLEKTADYIEGIESKEVHKKAEDKLNAANVLAEKLSEVTGEPVDTAVIEKLSELDPDVSGLLNKIAGDSSEVDSMGGPDTREKHASAPSNADARFMDWVTGP